MTCNALNFYAIFKESQGDLSGALSGDWRSAVPPAPKSEVPAKWRPFASPRGGFEVWLPAAACRRDSGLPLHSAAIGAELVNDSNTNKTAAADPSAVAAETDRD
jgi:hypothetical protein